MVSENGSAQVLTNSELRKLPSVDRLLQWLDGETLSSDFGHGLVVEAVRITLEGVRRDILAGGDCPSEAELVLEVSRVLDGLLRPSLRPVINATGVVVHTNLGRVPLSDRARQAFVLPDRLAD